MPYLSGETPQNGDRVKNRKGEVGTVTWVQLNYPSTPGHDAIAVFDNGMAVGVAMADEYTLIKRK